MRLRDFVIFSTLRLPPRSFFFLCSCSSWSSLFCSRAMVYGSPFSQTEAMDHSGRLRIAGNWKVEMKMLRSRWHTCGIFWMIPNEPSLRFLQSRIFDKQRYFPVASSDLYGTSWISSGHRETALQAYIGACSTGICSDCQQCIICTLCSTSSRERSKSIPSSGTALSRD